MKRERVEVYYERVIPLADYESFKMGVTKSAFLEEGDDAAEVDAILREECKILIRSEYTLVLKEREEYLTRLKQRYMKQLGR